MTFNQVSTAQPQLNNYHVDLEGCSIFYTQGGLKSDPTPILFLHGWGISAAPYHEMLKLLAQHYPVLAPDLPSFARSSCSNLIPDYDSYAKFLSSFLDTLNIQQVHLVGHSFGGGIAIALSALAPDRVKSVVLVDSTGIPSVSILEAVPRRTIEMIAQFFLPGLKLKLIDIPQIFFSNLLFNTGNVIQALLLSLQVDLRDLLPKIKAPCLLIWSEKDLTTLITAAREMAARIPNSRLTTVEEGWHEWGLWYPEKLTSIMLNFIRQVQCAHAVTVGRS